jgi:hypothetical protein
MAAYQPPWIKLPTTKSTFMLGSASRFAFVLTLMVLLGEGGVRVAAQLPVPVVGATLANVLGTPTQWDWAGNGALRGVLFTPGVQICLSSFTWLQLGKEAHACRRCSAPAPRASLSGIAVAYL